VKRRRGMSIAVAALGYVLASPSSGQSPIQLHDGPGGVTCEYYDAALKLPWFARGGDWVDAHGAAQGGAPFAAQRFDQTTKSLAFDVTTTFGAGAAPVPGAFLLRGLSTRGGSIVLMSRETPEPAKRPRLVLRLDGGRTVALGPKADTVIDCSSNISLGGRPELQVGPEQSSLLLFELPSAAAGRIRQATLEVSIARNYGEGTASVFVIGGRASTQAPPERGGLAAALPLDQGLERAPDVLFVESFESDRWRQQWVMDPRSSLTLVAAPDDFGFQPLNGRALRVRVAKGVSLGLDIRHRLGDKGTPEPEEAYFRYYLRLGSDWASDVDGGKLPGLSGTYGRAGWGGREPDGYNGWNMRMSFALQPPPGHPGRDLTVVGTEASLPKQRSPLHPENAAAIWPWADGFGGLLQRNRWYCIEQHVRLNTPGQADGVFRAWVDGRKVIDRAGIEYRYGNTLRIQEIWLNVYHGGIDPAPHDMHLYIDDVVVARSYIGPMPGK